MRSKILVQGALIGLLLGASPSRAGILHLEAVIPVALPYPAHTLNYACVDSLYAQQNKIGDREAFFSFVLGRPREEFEADVSEGIQTFYDFYGGVPRDTSHIVIDFNSSLNDWGGHWHHNPDRVTLSLLHLQGVCSYNIKGVFVHELTHKDSEAQYRFPALLRGLELYQERRDPEYVREQLEREGLLQEYLEELEKDERLATSNEISFLESTLQEKPLSPQERRLVQIQLENAQRRQQEPIPIGFSFN